MKQKCLEKLPGIPKDIICLLMLYSAQNTKEGNTWGQDVCEYMRVPDLSCQRVGYSYSILDELHHIQKLYDLPHVYTIIEASRLRKNNSNTYECISNSNAPTILLLLCTFMSLFIHILINVDIAMKFTCSSFLDVYYLLYGN